jgi:hypothetical protein
MPRMVRPRLENLVCSENREIAGPDGLAQTEVRQNGRHYNRRPAKWKAHPLGFCQQMTALLLDISHVFFCEHTKYAVGIRD